MIGSRLGPHEVTGKLGAGGMGEVWRGTDSRLKREVAIKVLPAAFAADRERLARFEREAQTLAALNHPNIAAIYGLEESNGTSALVMELVEGEDLSARIARGPLPVEEAIAIARQIAEALEAAHEQGIVHRDLKPANVKVRADGTVKVLDFGLAKAMEPIAAGTSASDPWPSKANQWEPSWSPDGTQLALREIENGESRIVSLVVGSSQPPRVLARNATRPAWSPDGRWIAFRDEGGIAVVRPDATGRGLDRFLPWRRATTARAETAPQ